MNKDFHSIEVSETVNTFLESLSDDELRNIINDSDQESRLDELVQKCPILSKLNQEKEMLIAKNKSLADYNYNREPTYSELKKVLKDTHKQSVEKKQNLIEKQVKLNKLKPKMTPDTLRGLLQIAAQESEEQSEEIAKQYLSGEKTYEEFINEFIKKRTEYHVRRIKYEKLIDSIQNGTSNQINLGNNSGSSISINRPSTSLSNQSNSIINPPLPSNHMFGSNPSYPAAPFAYQPFNTSVQPIRSAPLPPNMMELPPYPLNQYIPQQPTFPFNMNQPNHR